MSFHTWSTTGFAFTLFLAVGCSSGGESAPVPPVEPAPVPPVEPAPVPPASGELRVILPQGENNPSTAGVWKGDGSGIAKKSNGELALLGPDDKVTALEPCTFINNGDSVLMGVQVAIKREDDNHSTVVKGDDHTIVEGEIINGFVDLKYLSGNNDCLKNLEG
ncbi:hypothetical protein PN498_00045 [Oscillatoria sp. CS-180]|uniref:hypothetical protein n=1 Tax=Oscillatoria sp. CS-180 TaxID=3021720 RepID=UPI00232D14F1|nr:hypothetical protein [Oscillatoria sp. CS-180]MDB9524360.1 hypothetical protein [Oscillatoria sp. CS-180]